MAERGHLGIVLLIPDWTKLGVADADKLATMRSEEDKIARAEWAKRFEGARAHIPAKFAWIESLKPLRFPLSDLWKARLPWFTSDHARRFFELWKERTNLLICGPADVGKTCLMVLHARWTFEMASYDAHEVKIAREKLANWTPRHRLDAPPRQAEWLPQVKEAQGLRFMTAPGLLDDRQQGPNETAMREALKATALYLDEVGREIGGAKGSGHVASSRRAAMLRVLEFRWAHERRFVSTSEHTPDELAEMYGTGSFRRIAGERSGATVIDLGEDNWAGLWIKKQANHGRNR